MAMPLGEQCRLMVERVLAQRGWALVEDEAAFLAEVEAEVNRRRPLARRPLDKLIEDAIVNRYGYLWHRACGARGTPRQRRALIELHQYLWPIALYRSGHQADIAEEAAQQALVNTWQSLDKVRDPGSFARYAAAIVENEVRRRLPAPAGPAGEGAGAVVVPLGGLRGEEGVAGPPSEPDAGAAPPSMTPELRARIEAALQVCLERDDERRIIVGIFLDDRTIKELADELQMKPTLISVHKFRALARLRACAALLDILDDLL